MWSLLDHLNALIVVPAIIAIVIATQWEGHSASIDSTIQASGGSIYLTADWIERDITNLGASLEPDQDAILDFVWGSETKQFTFRTAADTTLDSPAVVIRYRAIENEATHRFELQRYVVEGNNARLTGRSPASLRTATIRLLDDRGVDVPEGDTSGASSIDIRLVLDPPLGETDTEVTWARRFFPYALTRTY